MGFSFTYDVWDNDAPLHVICGATPYVLLKAHRGVRLNGSTDLITYGCLYLYLGGPWVTSILWGDAVKPSAIGGEVTDQRGARPRTLLLRKPHGLRYAVIAGIAAAGCCALQLPAVASASAVGATVRNLAATGPVSSTPATGTPKLAATGT